MPQPIAPQSGGSRVRIPMKVMGYVIGLILLGRTMSVGSIQPVTEVSTRDVTWAANFATCVYRVPGNSRSLSPPGAVRDLP